MNLLFAQVDFIVVGVEAGLSLDPKDPGNWTEGKCGCGVLLGTKYGISAAVYPHVDIPNLTPTAAQLIRQTDYWDKTGCKFLPPRAALCFYDCAINQGQGTAIRLMQQACCVQVDGEVGPDTQSAFSRVTEWQTAKFMCLRDERYEATKNFDQYRDSWLTRLFTISMAPLTP